jgi:hypothetical protein
MAILWPRQQEFAADVARIVGNHIVSGDTGSAIDLQLMLTIQMQRSIATNSAELTQMASFFGIACGLLLIEVFSWITAIVTSV